MKQFQKGDFVRYKIKNEVGLVGGVYNRGEQQMIRCWWHMGGTRSLIDVDQVEVLTLDQVINEDFSNNYCKASMIERQLRLQEDGDVSDLIDESSIREEVKIMVSNTNDNSDYYENEINMYEEEREF